MLHTRNLKAQFY